MRLRDVFSLFCVCNRPLPTNGCAPRLSYMLSPRMAPLQFADQIADQLARCATSSSAATNEAKRRGLVKQRLVRLGEFHLRRHPQNGPRHIWAKFFAAHSAVCCLLNGWAVLCGDIAAHPPHARRTGADTDGRGKRRSTADGLHRLLKWCHGSFFVNTNVIVKQTPT